MSASDATSAKPGSLFADTQSNNSLLNGFNSYCQSVQDTLSAPVKDALDAYGTSSVRYNIRQNGAAQQEADGKQMARDAIESYNGKSAEELGRVAEKLRADPGAVPKPAVQNY